MGIFNIDWNAMQVTMNGEPVELVPINEYESIQTIPVDDKVIEVSNSMHQILRDAEEKAVKDILRKHLNREPTLDDAKLCIRVLYPAPHNNRYDLIYDGIFLGTIILPGYPDILSI